MANETLQDKEITVCWAVRNAKGEVLSKEEQVLKVPALSSAWMDKVDLQYVDERNQYVSYEALENGKTVSEGTVLFAYPKYFNFEDPEISLKVEGDEIIVSSKAYAKSVEILNAREDIVLSDNYFDLNADEKRVKILSGSVDGLKVRSVYDIH